MPGTRTQVCCNIQTSLISYITTLKLRGILHNSLITFVHHHMYLYLSSIAYNVAHTSHSLAQAYNNNVYPMAYPTNVYNVQKMVHSKYIIHDRENTIQIILIIIKLFRGCT